MTKRKLHNDLERLREEINHLAADDLESRKRLNNLINEVEAKLENPDPDEVDGLMKNLKDAIAHFETEYPRATAILNDIMVTLSNMGI
jgi:seryl-tRNA synthetase